MTRQHKTPRQRAEEALGIANRRVITLDRKVDALRSDLAQADREHRDAIVRRDYLAQHPDLQHNPTSTSTGDPA